jgi:purine-cytosine permease-like protein
MNNRLMISGILSFGTSCIGYSASWCSFSADYNTYFPENTSQLKIFVLTYIGNVLSIIPIELLGAAAYTVTYTNDNWSDAYKMNNIGGLLGANLSSLGSLSKYLLIILSLSTVAGNIPNIYSLSLSAQVIAPIFKRIPRILYTVIGTIIYIFFGIVGANNFNSRLTSFIDVISYWFSIYIVIIFEDHLLFRGCQFKNYDFHIWNNRKLLPISISAILSGLIGIVGIALGMSQTWFSGPIAKAIQGANIGFETGFIFTGITFPLFRFIELYFIKR